MPIYEYQCRNCGTCFEALVWSSKDESSLKCPACGGVEARRMLSSFCTGGGKADESRSSCGPGPGRFS